MKRYRVTLYPGAGYWTESIEVKACNDDEALALAVVRGCGCAIDETDDAFNEYLDNESWYYLDLSEHNLDNCLVLLDNALIEELD